MHFCQSSANASPFPVEKAHIAPSVRTRRSMGRIKHKKSPHSSETQGKMFSARADHEKKPSNGAKNAPFEGFGYAYCTR